MRLIPYAQATTNDYFLGCTTKNNYNTNNPFSEETEYNGHDFSPDLSMPPFNLKLQFFVHQTDKHMLSIAPTRTGKGRGLILPNLLNLPDHSVLVIDPKGENALVTARHRKKRT